MKKLLLSLSLIAAFGTAQAQTNVFAFGFDGTTDAMVAAGWSRSNQSTSPSTTLWTIATYTPVVVSTTPPVVQPTPFQTQAYTNGQTAPVPLGQAGGANSFALVNYTSSSSALANGATISNWLFTPIVNVQNGDVVTFYSRIGKYSATNTASFADNLQLRMSTNGGFTTAPSTGPTDLGDYTNLLVDINPNFNLTSYPATWTQYSYTVAGLDGPTDVKFAFRYYVINGGPNGTNSDIIGLDSFSVDRPLSTENFFASNYAVYPNPASNMLNINSKSGAPLKNVQITDLNGRIVKTLNAGNVSETQINISDLNSGVYFLKISSDLGVGTTKIVKN